MSDLSELVGKLVDLEGPDRRMDAEIDAALFGGRPSHDFPLDTAGGRLRASYSFGTVFLSHDPHQNGGHVLLTHYRDSGPYTASLDAAIALVERVLPGWQWTIGTTHAEFLNEGEPRFSCDLAGPVTFFRNEDGYEDISYTGFGARGCNAAVATMIALLRAKGGVE